MKQSDFDGAELALRLLTQKSERDIQKTVGASQIGDPCTYHLAESMLPRTEEEHESKYWLGAKVGTAVHYLLESLIEDADLEQFPELKGAKVEEKIHLGTIEGYGEITSKPDLALVEMKHLIDWKTTSRAKSKKLQFAFDYPDRADEDSLYTVQKYTAQTQLYGWGLNRAGIEIDKLSLVFINRDGTTSKDIWSTTFDYSEEFALAVWERFENIWTLLQDYANIEDMARHPSCFKCKSSNTPTLIIN